MFPFKKILVLVLIVGTAIGLLLFNQRKVEVTNYIASSAPIDLPGLSAPIAPPDTYVDSPDGTATVTMKKTVNKDGTIYSFYAKNKENPEKLVFTKTLDRESSFSIPMNAWSPNNKYFFLKEKSGNDANYYVFQASGGPFSSGEVYLSPDDVFNEKHPDLILTDTTGWADDTLLILNTNRSNGSEGPSFWFELGRQSISQLSRRFN